jgi:hypothetical protein
MCCGDNKVVDIIGKTGEPGASAWLPLFAAVTDGDRVVRQVIGWYGGTGTPPPYLYFYEGADGLVVDIGNATDIKGPQGEKGDTGEGIDGWTAITANVVDGERVVQQTVDWVGGSGEKPATGDYISPLGLTGDISLATDIRGPVGPEGPQGPAGSDVTNGRVKISSDDTAIGFIEDKVTVGGRIVKEVTGSGANEGLKLTFPKGINQTLWNIDYSPGTSYTTITNLEYTTPNDGVTRGYVINFSAVATISSIESNDRTAVVHYAIFLNGTNAGVSTYAGCYSKSGTSRPERSVSLCYSIELPPNTVVQVRVYKESESGGGSGTAQSKNNILSIMGV